MSGKDGKDSEGKKGGIILGIGARIEGMVPGQQCYTDSIKCTTSKCANFLQMSTF